MKPQANPRVFLSWAVVATLLVLGFGLFVHWPWLQAEHDRLEPARRILIWSADAAALCWFVWFGVRYGFLGRPIPDALSREWESRSLLAGLLVAFGVDLAITAVTAWDEETGPARALPAAGQIVGGRPTVNGHKAYVVCRFKDRDGVWRQSRLQVRLADQPPAVRDAIRQGRFPVPVAVTYDPHWPQRCWLDGFNNEEDNRLYWMSGAFLLFQALCIPIALQYGAWRSLAGGFPLGKVLPLWAELTPFFLAAVAKFCEGEC